MPNKLIPEKLFYNSKTNECEGDNIEGIFQYIILQEWWVIFPLDETTPYDDTVVAHSMDEYISKTKNKNTIIVNNASIPYKCCPYEIEIFERVYSIPYFSYNKLECDIDGDTTKVDYPKKW